MFCTSELGQKMRDRAEAEAGVSGELSLWCRPNKTDVPTFHDAHTPAGEGVLRSDLVWDPFVVLF